MAHDVQVAQRLQNFLGRDVRDMFVVLPDRNRLSFLKLSRYTFRSPEEDCDTA